MQRFFATFPDEWPGAGLLLLRLTLAASLFADAAVTLRGPMFPQAILAAGEILTGCLIVVGIWTPIAGVIACVVQFGLMLMTPGVIELHLLRAAIGLGLALLGPGAWSIDARLFGRRRVEIKPLRED